MKRPFLVSGFVAVNLLLAAAGVWRLNVRPEPVHSDGDLAEVASSEALPESTEVKGGSQRGSERMSEPHGNPVPIPTLSFDAGELKRGELDLDLVVSPECAYHGQTMTAVLSTEPGAHVSLIVAYADGRSHGTWYVGPVAPNGTLSFPWTVPHFATTGRGHVFVAGHDPATERSGTGGAAFRVEEQGAC